MCDSNRIAHRGCIARFGPLRPKSSKSSGFVHEIELFKRDWNEWHFQARLKFSSEPPTKPLFLWGLLKRSILNISSEIELFKRDWKIQVKAWNFQAFKRDCFFSRFGPSGEAIAKITPKTLFHATEMRFPKKRIPKHIFHVILWITNEYMICDFRENSPPPGN